MFNICDRCKATNVPLTMSRFNTQMICQKCLERERMHPLYEQAVKAELEAVLRGDMNFPGIGLPPDLVDDNDPSKPEGI